jgi:hypothetical protein
VGAVLEVMQIIAVLFEDIDEQEPGLTSYWVTTRRKTGWFFEDF